MSPDPAVQVDRYVSYLDEIALPVTLDEILTDQVLAESPRPIRLRRPQTQRGWVVALVTAIVAVVVVAAIRLLVSGGGESSPVIGSAGPEPWERVDWGDVRAGFGFSAMTDLAASTRAVVASGDGDNGEVLWVATDQAAEDWRLLPGALGRGDVKVGSIAPYGDGGFLAVGIDSDRDGAVWISDEGTEWRRVEHQPSLSEEGAWVWMLGVAARGDDLVAVGKVDRDGEHRARVWNSNDGITWSEAVDGPFVGDDPESQQQMEGVVWTGSEFIAYGWEARNFAGFTAAIWTSVNGTDWVRATFSEPADHRDPGQNGVRGIAVGEDLLLAPANLNEGPALLSSTNGVNWTVVPLDADLFTAVEIGDIAPTEDGFVLVGWRQLAGDRYEAVAYSSTDGLTWTPDESVSGAFDNSRPGRVAVYLRTVVAVGSEDHPGRSSQAAIWIRSP